jgi:hypothetical protein
MLKTVLRKGIIVPLEPLPPEWEEGHLWRSREQPPDTLISTLGQNP